MKKVKRKTAFFKPYPKSKIRYLTSETSQQLARGFVPVLFMSFRLPPYIPFALLPLFAGCGRAPIPAQAQPAQTQNVAPVVASAPQSYPELRIGGHGTSAGKFAALQDFRFAPDGTIWTVEASGKRYGNEIFPGNNRVQHLSDAGAPLGQFPIPADAFPYRIVADGAGTVYLTGWDQSRVTAYRENGELKKNWDIPFALALAPYQGGVAATSGPQRESADKIVVINGDRAREVKLSQPLARVRDLATGANGHFWIVAAVNQVYEFDQNGQLLQTIGAGTAARKGDGNEWYDVLAVQNDGTLLGMDAGTITRRAPDGNLLLRPDSIGGGRTYNRLQSVRVDPAGRIWVADFNMPQATQTEDSRPIIARLASDSFDPKTPGVVNLSARTLGLEPKLESPAPGHIAYDLKPFPLSFELPAAKRNLASARVSWVARDADKNAVDRGEFALDLGGRGAVSQSFDWTPPRFGWYQVTAVLLDGETPIKHAVALCGVTPPFANLPKFEQIAGLDRRTDVPRQMFAGMPALRLDATDEEWLRIDEQVVPLAKQLGAQVWMQFVEPKDLRPEWIGKVAGQFKGRVRYYEFINEPDLKKLSGAQYADAIRPAVAALRAADPQARVLGPGTVEIRLSWMKQFLEAGGAKLVDEWSFHPYEGHESTDPNYLKAKMTAMRGLLRQYGIGDIALWQGEHAIAAQRSDVIWPNTQAERWVSDRDVFEQFGIPVERDMHFYLNPRGYGKVPAYAWTYQGPLALSLVARTRYAMTRDKKYAGTLDFGPNGNGLLTGLRFEDGGETIVSLRANNVESGGKVGLSQDFSVNARRLSVVDAWGNERSIAVTGNRVTLFLDGLPLYVRLPRGVTLKPVARNWGANLARQASFSSPGAQRVEVLNDGLLQSIHRYEAGYNLPPSDTNAGQIFRALMAPAGDDTPKPAIVTARWSAPQNVKTVLLKGTRADNQHCALLDYEIEAEVGGRWQTVASVKTAVAPSEFGGAMETPLTSWSRDIADHLVSLPRPFTATAIRLSAKRATRGIIPDQFAIEARRQWKAHEEPMSLDLAEIEIYG